MLTFLNKNLKCVFDIILLINYKILRGEFSLFNIIKVARPPLTIAYADDDCYGVCNMFYNVNVLLSSNGLYA